MAVNTGKIQRKHREFNLNLNVATLKFIYITKNTCYSCTEEKKKKKKGKLVVNTGKTILT